MDNSQQNLLRLTADIVSAHVSNNAVSITDLPTVVSSVYSSLSSLGNPIEPTSALVPAVSVRSSIKPDYIVCLEDGVQLKMLKRYLMTQFGMTPEQYRAKWGLPNDYPMVAPNYSKLRRDLAINFGLGSDGRGGRRKAA